MSRPVSPYRWLREFCGRLHQSALGVRSESLVSRGVGDHVRDDAEARPNTLARTEALSVQLDVQVFLVPVLFEAQFLLPLFLPGSIGDESLPPICALGDSLAVSRKPIDDRQGRDGESVA
jgi:hypothetical protein